MKKEIQAKVKLVSITGASKLVEGLTTYRIRQLCQTGQLPSFKSGNKYLIPEDVLLDFVKIPSCPYVEPEEQEPEPVHFEDFESQHGLESLICPHCDFKHGEQDYRLWELQDEGEFICEDCGQTMKYHRNYVAVFRTEPLKR